THLHPDHFDPVALRQALSDDGTVFAEASMAASVAAKGLPVASLAMWEPFSAGGFDGHDFLVVPVPAADGFGDAQVSWVVRAAGRRFIHCGDTIRHGHRRRIGRAYGPFDVAFPADQRLRADRPRALDDGAVRDDARGRAAG